MRANRFRNCKKGLLPLAAAGFLLCCASSAQAQHFAAAAEKDAAAAWRDSESGGYFAQMPHPAFGGPSSGRAAETLQGIEPSAGEDKDPGDPAPPPLSTQQGATPQEFQK